MPYFPFQVRIFFFSIFVFALPSYAFAATLSFTPATGTYEQGKTFTASVVVESDTEVNVAESEITFDAAVLSVQSVSKEGSAFSLWTVEPKFSNTDGTISFGGGSPTPFTGKKTVLSVVFKGLKEGSGAVSFLKDKSSVLAADGKGTNALSDVKGAAYTVSKAEAKAPPKEPPKESEAPKGEVPTIPVVSSGTHADPEKWYKENTAKFSWDVPASVTSLKILFDESPRSSPTVVYDPPLIEKEIKDIADGVHYFHILFRNASGSGTAAHRKVMVDKTPPEKFSVTQKEDSTGSGNILLQFNATDTASGIDRYEVNVDGGKMTPVALKDITADGYALSGQDPGEHTAKILAYDKAGNVTESELKFTVAGKVPPPAKKAVEEEVPVNAGVGTMYWIALLFFVALAVFFGAKMFSERRRYMSDRELL
ncbi:MAG: hypothetical protein HYT94_01355, partial [Parcubacteria group bacterium]|nr:hypothetical protein [Parcubacteria group bacterium]